MVMEKESLLFFVVLFLFLITGIVTLLGLIQKVNIEKKYLNALFSTLVLESVVAVLYMFSHTDFFTDYTHEEILVIKKELPLQFQAKLKSEIVFALNQNIQLRHQVDSLGEALKYTKEDYQQLLETNLALQKKIEQALFDNKLALEYKLKYEKSNKQFLVEMSHLNSLISEWGSSVNFAWKSEQKKEMAQLLQGAFKRIQFMKHDELPNDNPLKAHELLVAYQKNKGFKQTGFLTTEVISMMIKDYLNQSSNGL